MISARGGANLISRKLVTVIVSSFLIVSLILNLHFYVNLNKESENNFNNIRARALATLGSELATMAYFLDRFVSTMNYSIIHEEIKWAIPRAGWEVDICTQGLSENSALLYYELRRTISFMESYFVFHSYGTLNTTKVQQITPLLRQIANSFAGLYLLKDQDPIRNLSNSDAETVISNCQQVQDIIQH